LAELCTRVRQCLLSGASGCSPETPLPAAHGMPVAAAAIVERTFGWLGRCRRLSKGFENLSRMHAAFVILAMLRLMLRRIVSLRAAAWLSGPTL